MQDKYLVCPYHRVDGIPRSFQETGAHHFFFVAKTIGEVARQQIVKITGNRRSFATRLNIDGITITPTLKSE
ncbi:MAG: hypothetical protein CM1200mP40_10220 [Gammaproteobacteria bacterium]|nr:MAG: hypothetical protein CM1200mP40_10220 [Gammaproteobacteria bacterium]